ncbi:MAG TPA: pitrilysin family protein [Ornithinicoccus sp.]|jgi:predicted Zn-dependent peptidase|nr:pitrilysin family protein [Ornithinicoccus sp.]
MTSALPRPAVAEPRPWAFPTPSVHRLGNGIEVQLFDLPGQHVLAVRVGVPAPLAAEPTGAEGVALIMSRCLDEGTARRDGDAMAAELERHGVALGSGVGERGVLVDLDVTARHLRPALELLTECLAEPVFPEHEVRRHQRVRLAEIAHEQADAASRAALQFAATYFHPDDRAHLPAGGTAASVAALTPEAVRDHHRATIRPEGARVVVAGDLGDHDRLLSHLEATLGSWRAGSGGAAPTGRTSGVRSADAGRVVFVARRGSVQTEVYAGRPGPDRRDPRGWGVYQVLSMVVGGSPHARVDRLLREQRGYTYGFTAGFRPRASGGLFVASGSVRSDATATALADLLEVLAMRGSDLTRTEVRQAGRFIAHTAPARYATADVVAAEAMGLALDGFTPEFVTANLEQVRTLHLEDAAAAWDAWADQPWTIVLVGDPAHAAEVEALGLGPFELVQGGPPSQVPSPAEAWGAET